ncbi:MAG TPA: 50S ribosomal protein L25/general stress protein Ctc [Gemmatimonadaceae bacterium]|nr:50S ribosomal protein L25/general stress protein Ctc [Gemmatimonadaceae bacterium]
MATAQLSGSLRENSGKGAARTLRRDGQVPAVIYGHGREPQSLSINTRELEKLLDHISAESTVIDLMLDGRSARTLIREIQRHPFKRQILHVDFQELVAGEKVTVRVPIVLVGIPDGVRMDGGVLDQTLRDLEVEVDPSNIPNHIELDVTSLTIGSSIHVSDLPLPEGVEIAGDADASVCVVSAPRAAVEETAVATEEGDAVAEPEVIRKAKTDEDEDEGAKK